MDKAKYWLWLTMVFGTGSRRIWEMMCLFEEADEAYYELCAGSSPARLTDAERKAVASVPLERAEELLAEYEKKGVYAACYSSAYYPPQLRHIMNPPAILFYKGDIGCLTGTKTVTSVGARKASDYSLSVTERICRELAENGVVIVSGFAVGIDITSHMAAASVNRPTACVLGCGIDVDYPKDNIRFRDEILAAGGVFVSEFPLGTPPHSGNFPKRNRILAALGRAAAVFEASVKSGSLITAALAAEQGREVYCLPPANIFSSAYSGNIKLLNEGAVPFFSAADILSCFDIGTSAYAEVRTDAYGILEKERAVLKAHGRTPQVRRAVRVEPAGYEEHESASDTGSTAAAEALSELQRLIFAELSEGALHADILSQRLEIDSSELMCELTEMELMGAVRQLPGKIFEKC